MWDVTRSLFQVKYINDSMFIKDLVKWCHYNVTLENSDIMLVSRLQFDGGPCAVIAPVQSYVIRQAFFSENPVDNLSTLTGMFV
jgi:hypothetical protein